MLHVDSLNIVTPFGFVKRAVAKVPTFERLTQRRTCGTWNDLPGCARRERAYIPASLTRLSSVARIIAVANQKGGVGKTTTAVNLAASLAAAEQRTLLVDGDPQGNATSGIGITRDAIAATIYDVLIGSTSAAEAIIREVQFRHLDLLPATPELAGAEVELVDHPRRDSAMRAALSGVSSQYDYVLIDCPPSLSLITVNMLAAADALLIPVQCEYYALEGLAQLLDTIEAVRERLNEKLEVLAIVLTMEDRRNRLSMQVIDEVRKHFPKLVARARIPRTVRLAEAPSHGKPISVYDPQSRAARAYAELARELMARLKAREPIPLAGAIA